MLICLCQNTLRLISLVSSVMLKTGLPKKMIINFQKIKELVFLHPNPRNIVYPSSVEITEQIKVAKLLAVFIQSNFCCEEHVKYILTVCSQCLYLLKLLRAKGLQLPNFTMFV